MEYTVRDSAIETGMALNWGSIGGFDMDSRRFAAGVAWLGSLFLAVTLGAATQSPMRPSAPPPRPVGPPTAALAKTGPLINQLYQQQFAPIPSLPPGRVTADDPVSLVVETTIEDAPVVCERIVVLGGSVNRTDRNLVFADLPLAQLPLLAAHDGVRRLRRPYHSEPHVLSEGVGLHSADVMHGLGFTGDGVKIGVLDCGGFAGYQALLGTELPPSVTLWTGGSDPVGAGAHGTGCAEIVFDMAPDATFFLAHDDTEADFYSAVDWLIAQDVDIVSYSCGWVFPAPHDGVGLPYNPVNAKIDEARAAGILWVSSAGNAADDDTYQGAFNDPGRGQLARLRRLLRQRLGLAPDRHPRITRCCAGTTGRPTPTVSGASNDYDLYLWYWDGVAWQQVGELQQPAERQPGRAAVRGDRVHAGGQTTGTGSRSGGSTPTAAQFLDLRKDSAGAFTVNNPEHSVNIPGRVAGRPRGRRGPLVEHRPGAVLEPWADPRSRRLPDRWSPQTRHRGRRRRQHRHLRTERRSAVAQRHGVLRHLGGVSACRWRRRAPARGEPDPRRRVAGAAPLAAVDMGPLGPDNDYGWGMMILEPSLIFADGFETGDTARWSDASP